MIRKSIEPGTTVWNCEFGFGTFIKWNKGNDNFAVVKFDKRILSIPGKYSTEIEPESEPKKEQEFNPPV